MHSEKLGALFNEIERINHVAKCLESLRIPSTVTDIKKSRVFISGRDGFGWSIDHDHKYVGMMLSEAGAKLTNRPLLASVFHSVYWWRVLLTRRALPIRIMKRLHRMKVIATITNRFDFDSNFHAAKSLVDTWVVGNKYERDRLLNSSTRAKWQPFYVDEQVFSKVPDTREELCEKLGIDYSAVKDRYIIANFQRDTEGVDLISPKRQKNPERLVRILSRLQNRDDWVLMLAGPRRHYLVDQCEKLSIPYIFVGERPRSGIDDITTNLQSDERMALLNNLADCSLTTSRWEGGPKAIIEAAYTNAYVLCTQVGNAPDLLPPECLYLEDDDAVEKLSAAISQHGSDSFDDILERTNERVLFLCNREASVARWSEIYSEL